MTPQKEKYRLNPDLKRFTPWMETALKQARQAFQADEIPVGAVLLDEADRLLAAASNQPISRHDPTAHAEIRVLREAGQIQKNYRLQGSILVCTLEPCLMCAGALIQARIAGLVFGSRDPKAGAIVSRMNIFEAFPWLNHRFWVQEGVLGESCRGLLQSFFAAKRK